ncbi:hypothetical protein LIER_07354 [Lithospermum erythrorhizon]|uniref:Uncharacterized protein n=1 Tax=Lithospermum erythrorhizon TaxID=34254 RepID=A0AAV3P9G6_LITER
MSTRLSHVTERSSDNVDQPILNVDEELMRVQRVIWLSDSDRGKGYCVDFLSISLHAVSTDSEAYPSPCIYAQIDTGTDGEESEESDSESNEIDLSKVTEMRLMPSDPSQSTIYLH